MWYSMCHIWHIEHDNVASALGRPLVTRIQIARPDILKTFEARSPVFKPGDLAAIFALNRDAWRLARGMSLTSFERYMLERTPLKMVRFNFPQRAVPGYVWGEVPLLEVLLGLLSGSYLSHYTAMRLHGLTEQLPKTIYVSQEKPRATKYYAADLEEIEQEAIDAAFRNAPRTSSNEITVGDERVVLLHGASQNELGVTSSAASYDSVRPLQLRYTTLERTLIDIVIRPIYAGGVFEVAKAYEKAKEQDVSINAMASMLRRMQLAYPYHQAVGFYLERANYKSSLIDLFKSEPMERDFYLTHGMGKTRYVKDWRLHVPEGF
jgi:predicted transcriptional regulator of viral defense system